MFDYENPYAFKGSRDFVKYHTPKPKPLGFWTILIALLIGLAVGCGWMYLETLPWPKPGCICFHKDPARPGCLLPLRDCPIHGHLDR